MKPFTSLAGVIKRQLCDVQWLANAVLASVRRGPTVIIPHGDMVLQAGDVLVVVTDGPATANLAPPLPALACGHRPGLQPQLPAGANPVAVCRPPAAYFTR